MSSIVVDRSCSRPAVGCAIAALAGLLIGMSPVAATAAEWTAELHSVTPEQGRTLLALARDFFQHPELPDAPYILCIAPVDAAASDSEAKASLADAMEVVEGATRRMGYTSYPDISDEYERLRLSKMLAEGRWMRQFKKSMEQCLYAQPEVRAKPNRD
jgi:hypothetical protein